MTRSLKALLVAVPDSGWAPGNTIEHAIPSVKRMGAFLESRFSGASVEILDDTGVITKTTLLAKLHGLKLTKDDLFVLVFYGHGIPASPSHPYQAWALTAPKEELTDSDLAGFLRQSNCKDNVVVSACCYGRGLFIPGTERTDGEELSAEEIDLVTTRAPIAFKQYAIDLGRTLKERAPGHFVLISAAAVNKLVLKAVAPELLCRVQKAAERNQRYLGLWLEFRRNRVGGGHFFVDVRPPWRLGRRVLGP
ncbi:MAG: hypothetical protein WKG01_23740 [Kofleriaceae bacterium]